MLLITIGDDLTENKIENILSIDKIYLVIAPEIYQKYQLFQKRKRFISSDDFNLETIKNLLQGK